MRPIRLQFNGQKNKRTYLLYCIIFNLLSYYMAGQPVVHPTDASKFREQYLSTLSHQIRNDDKNLQANKIYKKTGQTPTIVLDTRTSAERLADKARLKVEVRSGLKAIMDDSTADKVVQELDPDSLEYLAQHLPEVVSILKPKYKYGVPFVIFTTFLREYMRANMESREYLAGSQQASGKEVLMGIRQILGQMVSEVDLVRVAEALDRNITGQVTQNTKGMMDVVRRDIEELRTIIPTRDQLIAELETSNELLAREIQKQLSDALEELPTTQQITLQLKKLYDAKNMRDAKAQEQVLEKLHELLNVQPEVFEQMALIRREVAQSGEQNARSVNQLREDIKKQIEMSDELARVRSQHSKAELTSAIGTVARDLQIQLAQNADMTQTEIKSFVTEALQRELASQLSSLKGTFEEEARARQEYDRSLKTISAGLTDEQKAELRRLRDAPRTNDVAGKRAYVNTMLRSKGQGKEIGELILGDQKRGDFIRSIVGEKAEGALTSADFDRIIDVINQRVGILASARTVGGTPAEGSAEGSGLRGRPKGTTRGRIKGGGITTQTDFDAGVEVNPKRYVPFGRFHINTQKLNDDIITLKRPSGCNVDGFPVKRVSKDMANVMRTIVGGGHPEYRQLEKLSDEEKLYLTKLIKKSNLSDRLSVPTPNRDDDDKDVHEFEVMKGEIQSGNDNVDMVKKFKILVLKLLRKELLPPNQAKNLLLELATLGY